MRLIMIIAYGVGFAIGYVRAWHQLYPRMVALCWIASWCVLTKLVSYLSHDGAIVLWFIACLGLVLLWPLGGDDWPWGGGPDAGDGSHWFRLRR